jgi:hypothetical protein
MKVNRLSAFFNFTKAPASGDPEASLTTPWTLPVFCAHSELQATAKTANTNAMGPMWRGIISPPLILGRSDEPLWQALRFNAEAT